MKIIARHALEVGLASAVPLPLLDDLLEARAGKRLIRALADAYALQLSPESVAALAGGARHGVLGRAAKVALLWPLKRALRKTFFVLGAHAAVVKVSRWLERGVLVDWALARGWLGPASGHTAEEVGRGIDEVLGASSSGPIRSAARALRVETPLAAADVVHWLRAKLAGGPARDESAADRPQAEVPAALDGMASRLAHAVETAEADHFEALRTSLAARLAERPS